MLLSGYRRFALSAPSERPALKLFSRYVPVMTPEAGLDEPPDLIIYQWFGVVVLITIATRGIVGPG